LKKFSFDDLRNKVCVMTGGSGVIGFAIVEALASAGVKTAILSRDKTKTTKKINSLLNGNSYVIAVEADILSKSSLAEAKKEVNEKFGRINFLINCAGGNYPKATTADEKFNPDAYEKSFFGLGIEDIQKVFDLNFQGTLIPTMVFAEDMIENKNGVVLNISSVSSFNPLTKVSAYSAAKAAINNFTKWLAVHLAESHIRVNAIAPGFILSEQNRFLLLDKETGNLSQRGSKIISSTPMKRFIDAEEIQGAALFLLSDLSKAVTGIVLPVDGGFTAYSGV